jgi:hypothetical protein
MPSAIEQFESLPLDILLRILFRAVAKQSIVYWADATPFLREIWRRCIRPVVGNVNCLGSGAYAILGRPTWSGMLETAAIFGMDRIIGVLIDVAPGFDEYASFTAMEHCAGGNFYDKRTACNVRMICELTKMTKTADYRATLTSTQMRLFSACDAMILHGESDLARRVFVRHYPFPKSGDTACRKKRPMYYKWCGSYVVIHPPSISCSNPMPPRCRW